MSAQGFAQADKALGADESDSTRFHNIDGKTMQIDDMEARFRTERLAYEKRQSIMNQQLRGNMNHKLKNT